MTDKDAQASAPKATDGFFCEIPADPCAIVMFGASGDLAQRKLLPALFELAIHRASRRGFDCWDSRARR